MKKMKKILFLSAGLIVLLAFVGCKKDHTPANSTCRINQLTESLQNKTITYAINYNADGKISAVSFNGISISYAYGTNSSVLTVKFSDSTSVTATYMLGSDGKPVNLHEVFSNNSDWENVNYIYSNGQLSKAIYTASYEPNATAEYFAWKNGNLDSIIDTRSQDTTIYTFSYYTGKTYQPGDYIFYDAITGDGEINPFPGLPELVTRNLIKSFASTVRLAPYENENTDITYTFDADDKISSMDVESTLTKSTLVSYQYDCH